jgi:hypothetical protein
MKKQYRLELRRLMAARRRVGCAGRRHLAVVCRQIKKLRRELERMARADKKAVGRIDRRMAILEGRLSA